MPTLFERVWRPTCVACDRPACSAPFCAVCAESLYPNRPACPTCALPTHQPGCSCRTAKPPFARLVVPYLYGGELATALRRLKYGGCGEIAGALGRWIGPELAEAIRSSQSTLIVPVPSHWTTRAARGIDHLLEMAHAARPAIPLARVLRKHRRTPGQVGLPRHQRRNNLVQSFRLARRWRASVRGHRIILIDDVVTTMATSSCCSQMLLDAGASEVSVFALARAVD